jgi:hypothetical protein
VVEVPELAEQVRAVNSHLFGPEGRGSG